MKKLFLSCVIACASVVSSFAQFDCGSFDISAGYRGFLGKDCFGTSLHGAYIGTNFTFTELLGPIDLGLGVNFSQDVRTEAATVYPTVTETIMMASQDFQFPIYIRGRIDLGGCDLFLAVGPTFNVGVNLQDRLKENFFKNDWVVDFYKNREPNRDFSKPGTGGARYYKYSNFDVLVEGSLGFIFGECFRVQGTFGYGCLPRLIEDFDPDNKIMGVDTRSHNLQLSVGIAYEFGR